MTRINVVPVEELCDEHLRAEHRELTRIPNSLVHLVPPQDRVIVYTVPKEYTVRTNENPEGGVGHVRFFRDKLLFLRMRYTLICRELRARGFKGEDRWPSEAPTLRSLNKNYTPTPHALELNRKRIKERLPKNPHWTYPGKRPSYANK